MKTKHTPGPWKIESFITFDKSAITAEINGENKMIAKLTSTDIEANGKLIVAAPELLEACILARKLMLKSGVTVDNADQYILVDNAIKKATE